MFPIKNSFLIAAAALIVMSGCVENNELPRSKLRGI